MVGRPETTRGEKAVFKIALAFNVIREDAEEFVQEYRIKKFLQPELKINPRFFVIDQLRTRGFHSRNANGRNYTDTVSLFLEGDLKDVLRTTVRNTLTDFDTEERIEQRQILEKVLSHLEEKERVTLVMYFYYGASVEEIVKEVYGGVNQAYGKIHIRKLIEKLTGYKFLKAKKEKFEHEKYD